MSKTLKGHFLSDLHLFASRSTAFEIDSDLRNAASQSHTMILGGDIFDFKWSTFPTLDSSIKAAIDWLEDLMDTNPQCTFYYLLGNHDAHPKFVSELDRLALRHPRLEWKPFVLRIQECVFLHGDIIDCEPNHSKLQTRRKVHGTKPFPRIHSHWIYDLAVQARLHCAVMQIAIRQKTVFRKLTRYLQGEGLGHDNGIRHVYFGHTHRIVNAVSCDGLTFHNGGAAIQGLPFRIIETQLPFQNV